MIVRHDVPIGIHDNSGTKTVLPLYLWLTFLLAELISPEELAEHGVVEHEARKAILLLDHFGGRNIYHRRQRRINHRGIPVFQRSKVYRSWIFVNLQCNLTARS